MFAATFELREYVGVRALHFAIYGFWLRAIGLGFWVPFRGLVQDLVVQGSSRSRV